MVSYIVVQLPPKQSHMKSGGSRLCFSVYSLSQPKQPFIYVSFNFTFTRLNHIPTNYHFSSGFLIFPPNKFINISLYTDIFADLPFRGSFHLLETFLHARHQLYIVLLNVYRPTETLQYMMRLLDCLQPHIIRKLMQIIRLQIKIKIYPHNIRFVSYTLQNLSLIGLRLQYLRLPFTIYL